MKSFHGGYAIKRKPTEYGGTLFRSKLEARWAAFFDLMRWGPWQYEPFKVGRRLPDFLLPNDTLIEVKPATSLEQLAEALHTPKVMEIAAEWKHEFILVGIRPFDHRIGYSLRDSDYVCEPYDGEWVQAGKTVDWRAGEAH